MTTAPAFPMVQYTTTSEGLGPFALSASPVAGCIPIQILLGDASPYAGQEIGIIVQDGVRAEHSQGVYSETLHRITRARVVCSTDGLAEPIDWPAGVRDIYLFPIADRVAYLNALGQIEAAGGLKVGTMQFLPSGGDYEFKFGDDNPVDYLRFEPKAASPSTRSADRLGLPLGAVAGGPIVAPSFYLRGVAPAPDRAFGTAALLDASDVLQSYESPLYTYPIGRQLVNTSHGFASIVAVHPMLVGKIDGVGFLAGETVPLRDCGVIVTCKQQTNGDLLVRWSGNPQIDTVYTNDQGQSVRQVVTLQSPNLNIRLIVIGKKNA